MKTVNGKNYFNEESFKEACDLLEAGEHITIYVSCIGFTRAHYEGLNYMKALEEKYGERITINQTDHPYYSEWDYKLKG